MPHSYGEVARVTDAGLQFSPSGLDALRSLQVRPGSRMYGLWVTSAKGTAHRLPPLPTNPDGLVADEPLPTKDCGDQAQAYAHHLLLSPVPTGPDGMGWLSAFEIEVILNNIPGAIAALLAVLERHKVTLLSSETSFSGLSRTKFQAFAAFTHVSKLWEAERASLAAFDNERSPLDQSQSRREEQRRDLQIALMQRCGTLMIGALTALEADILVKDARARERTAYDGTTPSDRTKRGRNPTIDTGDADGLPPETVPFLADNYVNHGSSPWFLSGFLQGQIDRFVKSAKEYFGVPEFLPGLPPGDLPNRLGEWFNVVRRQSFFDPVYARLADFAPYRHEGENALQSSPSERVGPHECIATMRQEIEYLLAHRKYPESRIRDWWARDQLTRTHHSHWNKPVSCRALHTLAFGAIFRNYRLNPMEFRVEPGSRLLGVVPKTPPASPRQPNPPTGAHELFPGLLKRDFGTGTCALVCVAGSEGWARVRFLRPEWVRSCAAHIKISYAASRRVDGAPFEPLIGFLQCICEAVSLAKGNIESMRDDVTLDGDLSDDSRESGSVELVVFHPDAPFGEEQYRRSYRAAAWREGLKQELERALEAYAKKYETLQTEKTKGAATWKFCTQSNKSANDGPPVNPPVVRPLKEHIDSEIPEPKPASGNPA